jgi:hypothetical protein
MKGVIDMVKLREQYTLEELKKGVRNPFYHEFCRDITVGIRHEDYELYEKIALEKGVRVEMVIKRAIARYANMLREDED